MENPNDLIPSPTAEPVLPSPGTVLKSAPIEQGQVQLWLTKQFGPSYSTTVSGWISGIGIALVPFNVLLPGKWQLFWLLLFGGMAGGGAVAAGTLSKARSVSGIEGGKK